jgi:RNA polymerase sigma-70 factor, ECF subfamily
VGFAMTTTIYPRAAHVEPVEAREAQEVITFLFKEYRNPLLRYVLAFGIRPDDGEDIVQDVFLFLHRHIQLGRSRHNLRGWIFRVAHNLALKRHNANRRYLAATALQKDEAKSAPQLDPALNPEEHLATNRRQQRLLAVMGALPKQDRLCLYLRAEGLRYREIANVLGMSLGAVSVSLTRSLERIGRADEQ